MAKNLIDRLYGPAGLPWGTKFTELEATVAAVREVLTEEMFQQALARQAAQTERPTGVQRLSGLWPADAGRRYAGAASVRDRSRRCRLGRTEDALPEMSARFFPSEQEFGN